VFFGDDDYVPDAEPRPSDLDPAEAAGLRRALGKAHRRYSAFVNARMLVTGHLFQARFSSVDYLMAAARYAALNPVRAK
jgi:putative transposase